MKKKKIKIRKKKRILSQIKINKKRLIQKYEKHKTINRI